MRTIRHHHADPGNGALGVHRERGHAPPTGGDDVARQVPERSAGRLGLPVTILYGTGAVASAAKTTPIVTFLMLYYNQVVGLPALSVSFVLMISLLCDAFFDPLLGHVSDNFRSRWGRRLPFMYFSALPLTLFFIMLWIPPAGWSERALLGYLAACLIGVRFFDTFFELPHVALVPELTSDYHERTRLFTVRSLFESAAGLAISVLAYNVFMREEPDGSGGILSAGGYPAFALICGAIIFVFVLASSMGLHRRLPKAPIQPAQGRNGSGMARDFLETVRNPSLAVLGGASILIAVVSGIGSTLNLYWMIYYYRFSQAEITLLTVPALIGFIGAAATPAICRRIGKRDAAMALCCVYVSSGAVPMIARTLGWVEPDSIALFALVMGQCLLAPASMIMMLVVLSSMISDLVEEVEVRTGKRSEGLLLSTISFVRKLTTGVGALAAGVILAAVSFPRDAERGTVSEDTLTEMAWLYLSIKAALFLGTIFVLLRYKYTQQMHEANVATLQGAVTFRRAC